MIRRYDSGAAFLAENQAFLDTKPQISAFMALDAPLLEKTDKINYAARCEKDGKTLLAMKVEPYHLQLFGDADCAGELLDFLVRGGYEIQNYLSEKTLGDAAAREMEARFGIRYEEALAMAFMEARTLTEPSSPEVEAVNEGDLDEIYACMERFLVECNLQDKPNREAMRRNIGGFRVIRADGKIVSVGKAVRDIGGKHAHHQRLYARGIQRERICSKGGQHHQKRDPDGGENRGAERGQTEPRDQPPLSSAGL